MHRHRGALSIRAAVGHRTSKWGIRVSILGMSLLFGAPGLLFLYLVVIGQVLWPAALFGALNVAFGVLFLAVLRRNWSERRGSA
jgi:hypothetical protein